jgi:hypothetical protein
LNHVENQLHFDQLKLDILNPSFFKNCGDSPEIQGERSAITPEPDLVPDEGPQFFAAVVFIREFRNGRPKLRSQLRRGRVSLENIEFLRREPLRA